jgi:hypothetical protein
MWATIEWGKLHPRGLQLHTRWSPDRLEDAYQRCGTITSDYAKTFYLVSAWGRPVDAHIGRRCMSRDRRHCEGQCEHQR